MKLCFIRHGTTGLIEREQKPEDVLSVDGEDQVRSLAERMQPYRESITSLYSSDLARAYQSAEIIHTQLQLPIGHQVEKALREIDLWISPSDFADEQKMSEAKILLDQTHTKLNTFIKTLSEKKDDVHILVTHGNLIRAAIGSLLKMNIETIVRLSVSNASLSVVEYDENEDYYRLILFNDTSHL